MIVKEQTLAIIKPDAVLAKNAGKIIDIIENNNFNINKMAKVNFSKELAEKFYAVHKDRPFFKDLVDFMISGPTVVMVLEKENAIQAWRDLMGATDPKQAAPDTIRGKFGISLEDGNATHGSDATETANYEIGLVLPFLGNTN